MDKTNIGGFTVGNELSFAKRSERICVPLCEKTVVTELSDDFTLPDYRPEIRRLLKITASLPTPSSYVCATSAEFSGDVMYNVIYVGGDGKLCSVDLTAVYEADTAFSGNEDIENIGAYDEVEAENIIGRVTAPRKLNIRCRLRHLIRATGERTLEAELSVNADQDKIIKLTETLPSCFCAFADDDTYEIEENVPVSGNARVITTDAVPFISDSQVRDGAAAIRGSITLRVLYDSEGSDPITAERKIPFEAVIPINADGDGWECRAWGCSAGVSAEAEEGTVKCRIRLSLCAEAQKNLPVQITKDIFATDRACELIHEEIACSVGRYCGVGNFTVSGTSELSGLPESYDIISSSATAEAEEISFENGKYIMCGKCRFSALIFGDGEYSCREFELPFKYEFGDAEADADDYSAQLACPLVRIRGDKDTMSADAEICAALKVSSKENIPAVKSASFGEAENTGSRPAYTVVYVSDGESLWELSKKYSTDPAEIAKANGLKVSSPASPDSLSGVDFLII